MSQPKQITIIGGSYAKSNTGNFTARTADGSQYFIPAQMLQDAGVAAGTAPTFPMYGFANTRMIGAYIPGTTDLQMEADGITPVQVAREEISALFTTRKAFINILNSEFALETELLIDRRQIATSAGLTEEAIEALLAASI